MIEAYDKPIFDGLLHTGKPDLDALYRVGKIQLVHRTSYSGWTDPLGLPTAKWYDAVTAGVQAPRNIILIDHESWSYTTKTERQETATKYTILYQELKARKPQWRIGWYMDPIRRDYWRACQPIGSAQYLAWQQENSDLGAIMAPCTDVLMPSLYFFYTRDTPMGSGNADALGLYLERNIDEAKRVRRLYGRMDCPIYPYVWWMRHDGTRALDHDVWETIVREVMDQADGMVLWGGWQTPWDEQAPWWVTIKARLKDKRRTG